MDERSSRYIFDVPGAMSQLAKEADPLPPLPPVSEPANASGSATKDVLNIVELLERILSFLPSVEQNFTLRPLDLYVAQRVCRLWNSTIKGSLLLQRLMLREPYNVEGLRKGILNGRLQVGQPYYWPYSGPSIVYRDLKNIGIGVQYRWRHDGPPTIFLFESVSGRFEDIMSGLELAPTLKMRDRTFGVSEFEGQQGDIDTKIRQSLTNMSTVPFQTRRQPPPTTTLTFLRIRAVIDQAADISRILCTNIENDTSSWLDMLLCKFPDHKVELEIVLENHVTGCDPEPLACVLRHTRGREEGHRMRDLVEFLQYIKKKEGRLIKRVEMTLICFLIPEEKLRRARGSWLCTTIDDCEG